MAKRKVKKKVSNLLLIIILALSAYLVYCILDKDMINLSKNSNEPKIKNEEPKETKKEYKLSLVMVGDALIHNSVYEFAKTGEDTYDFNRYFKYISPITKEYDLAYYNQETILGGTELGLSNYPRFNSPQEVGDAFLNANFNLVSLANNHTLDRGESALANSCTYWNSKKDVVTAGSYCSNEEREESHVFTKNGIKIAFFSYTTLTNGLKVPEGKDYYVNVYSDEMAKNDIEKIRDEVDIVIVAMHWGVEYTHTPTQSQRNIAQYLESIGTDIIIGTHPHVIQPIEHINDTVVFYSLGNFISSQIGIERLIGMMASLEITKTVDKDIETIKIDNVKGDLLYTNKKQGDLRFTIIPFASLSTDLLSNKDELKSKYEAIINKNDDSIIVGSLG